VSKPSSKQSLYLLLAWLILWPWRWRQYVPLKQQYTYIRLHGMTSQKVACVIVSTMKIWRLKSQYPYYKVKSSMCLTTSNYLSTMPWRRMEEWRYSFTILDLGTRWGWVARFTPQLLHPMEITPITHWIGGWVGLQRRPACCGEEKNFLPLPGIKPWPSSW
jgi:hypothetical protein